MKKTIILLLICCCSVFLLTACTQNRTGKDIGEEKALSIALEHASVTKDDIANLKLGKDTEDGIAVYNIEFYAGDQEYDYEIEVATGEIHNYSRTAHGTGTNGGSTGEVSNDSQPADGIGTDGGATGTAIGEDDVREAVIERLPEAKNADIRMHRDWDDGREVYEGEFFLNGVEYDFEVDATTGKIVKWEEDR